MRAPWFAVLLGGCAAAAPAVAPPGPPPEAVKPAIAVFISYERGLALHITVGGTPYSGSVIAAADGSEIPLDARAGVATVDGDALSRLKSAASVTLAIAGDHVPLAFAPGTSPFVCASILDALRALDACKSPVDATAPEPASCDDEGARAWRAERAKHDAAFPTCFAKLDTATLDALAALPAEAHPRACDALRTAVGPEPSGDAAERYVAMCDGAATPEVVTRIRKAARMRTFDAAYAEAKAALDQGDGAKAAAFVRDYAITADPRLDELRRIGKRKLAGTYAALVAKAKAAIAPFSGGEIEATVCGIDGDRILLSIGFAPPPQRPPRRRRRGALSTESSQRLCGAPGPRPFVEQDTLALDRARRDAAQAVRAKTKHAVAIVGRCAGQTPWYERLPG